MKTLLLLSFVVATWAAAYKDSVARNKTFPAAVAAYEKDPANCIGNSFSNGKIQRRITVECDDLKVDTCSGFTAYSEDEKTIIISFRGSTKDTQIIADSEEALFAKDVDWIGGGKVSEYFNNAFIKLWNKGMKDDFNTLATKYPTYDVYITGHSLGGAMAALCSSFITSKKLFNDKQVFLYTFGEPRVGDKDFAKKMDKDLLHAFRVVHHKDPIPHFPMRYLEKYHHHEAEVWYHKEDMGPGADYTVCSRDDESIRCSDKEIIELDFKDHHTYFNVKLDEFGSDGCKYPSPSMIARQDRY